MTQMHEAIGIFVILHSATFIFNVYLSDTLADLALHALVLVLTM